MSLSHCLIAKAFLVHLPRPLSHCLIAKAFLVHLPRPLPSPSASCLRSPCSVAKPLFMSPNPCLVAEPLLPAAESLVIVLMLLSPSPSYRALLTLACQVLPAEPLFSVAKPAFIVSPRPGGRVGTRREQHRGGQKAQQRAFPMEQGRAAQSEPGTKFFVLRALAFLWREPLLD